MNIIEWIKKNKRLSIVIFAVFFLFLFLVLNLAVLVKRITRPEDGKTPQSPNMLQNTSFTTMSITTDKDQYSLSEKIVATIKANSPNEAIAGFDTLIQFDPSFLTLSNRRPPSLSNFDYYGQNSNNLISVAAVQKIDSNNEQKFSDTALFQVEFTPKKAGKTTLKVLFSPNATNESNLINKQSKDILTDVFNKEITIK